MLNSLLTSFSVTKSDKSDSICITDLHTFNNLLSKLSIIYYRNNIIYFFFSVLSWFNIHEDVILYLSNLITKIIGADLLFLFD